MFWGCLCPLLLMTGIFIFIVTCCSKPTTTAYIPEIQLHFKLEYPEEDRARLNISQTDSFGSDYIEFRYFPVDNPKIYYMPNQKAFYVENKDSIFDVKIRSKQFDIHCVDIILPALESLSDKTYKARKEYHDSLNCVKRSPYIDSIHYRIGFSDYANDFVIWHTQKGHIYPKQEQ